MSPTLQSRAAEGPREGQGGVQRARLVLVMEQGFLLPASKSVVTVLQCSGQ